MKKIHVLFFLLVGFAFGGGAQNQYWNYQSQNYATNPTSSVSIVHSNGMIYFFQTDVINSTLSATEIDPITMLPTGINKGISYPGLTLEGGFEDVNGDFVLYGYQAMVNGSFPFYLVISQNFSFNCYVHNTTVGRFVRGCSGFDAYNDPVYVFVMDNGKLFVAEPLSGNHNYMVTHGNGYPYSDISWDNTHNFFIASGRHPAPPGQFSTGPFVDIMKANLQGAILNPDLALTSIVQHNIYNQTTIGDDEFKTLHTQIDNDHLLVYHDLREGFVDIVWLTLVKNFTTLNPTIVNSRFFLYPAHKLFALDMIYDDINNRVNLLTELMYCDESAMPQQLAQVDPYTLTGMKVIQLDGGFGGNSPCPSMADPNIPIYATSLDMCRLSFNYHHQCGPVLVSGVVNSTRSVLSEASDVCLSTCDLPLTIWEVNTTPTISTFALNPTGVNANMNSPGSLSMQNDIVVYGVMCQDPNACSNQRAIRQGKMISVENPTKPEVSISGDHQYVCQGFDGEVYVSQYDLTGKRVWMTTVEPGIQNPLPNLHGVYLLQALDNKGHHASCKIVLP